MSISAGVIVFGQQISLPSLVLVARFKNWRRNRRSRRRWRWENTRCRKREADVKTERRGRRERRIEIQRKTGFLWYLVKKKKKKTKNIFLKKKKVLEVHRQLLAVNDFTFFFLVSLRVQPTQSQHCNDS